jgi:outer membrane protein TolC
LLGIPPVDLQHYLDFWKAEDERRAEQVHSVEVELVNLLETADLSKPEVMQRLGELREKNRNMYIPWAPAAACVGIPADLLRRRPDVREAERNAAAQAELIGIAQAELYPHFFLNGTLGWEATSLPKLFTPQGFANSGSNVGPSFQWNILNYGRIVNNVRLQDATFQQLVATYQNTVLTADQEVEDGLVSFLRSQQATKTLEVGLRALEDAEYYEHVQQRVGRIDIATYVTTATLLVSGADSWAQAMGSTAQGLIAVYRALGGGWQIRCQPGQPAPGLPAGVGGSGEEVPPPLPTTPSPLPAPVPPPPSTPGTVPSEPPPAPPAPSARPSADGTPHPDYRVSTFAG